MLFLYPTENTNFVPKIRPVLHASNAVLPKSKRQILFPHWQPPKFHQSFVLLLPPRHKPQRLLSAAHSQQFRSCHHFRYCNLHLGNFYKNRSGHRTVTSLIFMFPPVMINTVAPLTVSPLIYLLLSFVLKEIRCGPYLDEGELRKL